MVAWMKIFLLVLGLVFLDLIVQQFTQGEYGIVAVLMLLIRFLLAIVALILHAITHINEAPNDLLEIVTGFISLLVWFLRSIMAILLDVLSLPFRLIGGLLAQLPTPLGLGLGFNLSFTKADWDFLPQDILFGGFRIDLQTMTIQVALGEFNPLRIFMVRLYLTNRFGFSFFGNSARTYLDIFGSEWTFYDSNEGALAVYLKIKDGFIIDFPDIAAIGDEINDVCGSWWELCVPFTDLCASAYVVDPLCMLKEMAEYVTGENVMPTFEVKAILDPPKFTFSFESAFLELLDSVPVPPLGEWVDSVYARLLPQAVAGAMLSTNHDYIYMKLEELKLLCLKRMLKISMV